MPPRKRTPVEIIHFMIKDLRDIEHKAMGHDDYGPPYKIPHYSTFKIDGIKQLEDLSKALEVRGLCDPWIRNEAWRYHPKFGTRLTRAIKLFTRGMPLGLVLAIAATAAGYAMDEGHGHGGEGGEGGEGGHH